MPSNAVQFKFAQSYENTFVMLIYVQLNKKTNLNVNMIEIDYDTN